MQVQAQKAGFIDVIVAPVRTLGIWAEEARHRDGLQPGLRWLATVEAVFAAVLLVLSMAVAALFNLLAETAPAAAEWALKLVPATLAMGGIVDALLWFVVSVLALGASLYTAAWAVVALLKPAQPDGALRLLFNLNVKMTTPWMAFFIIPVLGWLAMVAGVVYSFWIVLGRVFPGLDGGKRIRVFLLFNVIALLLQMLLRAILNGLLAPFTAF